MEKLTIFFRKHKKLSRYIGAEAEFLAYLTELLTDKEKMRDEYEK